MLGFTLMSRVVIARFASPSAADLAAGFLNAQGIDAAYLDQGGKGSQSASVLVARADLAEAEALLAEVCRPGTFPDDRWARDFREALGETGSLRVTSGLHHALPIWIIGVVITAFLAISIGVHFLRQGS